MGPKEEEITGGTTEKVKFIAAGTAIALILELEEKKLFVHHSYFVMSRCRRYVFTLRLIDISDRSCILYLII
jgi:hypothetical protein